MALSLERQRLLAALMAADRAAIDQVAAESAVAAIAKIGEEAAPALRAASARVVGAGAMASVADRRLVDSLAGADIGVDIAFATDQTDVFTTPVVETMGCYETPITLEQLRGLVSHREKWPEQTAAMAVWMAEAAGRADRCVGEGGVAAYVPCEPQPDGLDSQPA